MDSCSSSTPPQIYDVFLSFRGDTRKTFTDHLFHALKEAGIYTFRDSEELARGNNISSGLPKAIQESKISIIVFSKDYASSTWCLDELVEIIECKKVKGQLVLLVFYHVDPSDICKQTGSFGDAFLIHDQNFKKRKLEKWRSALKAAASLSGFHLQDEYEADFIKKIVDEVLKELIPKQLHVAKYPVGLNSRVEVLTSLLGIGRNGVLIIGIYGMGGAGKTTTAKCLYNSICSQFDCCCFLENIRAQSEQSDGLVHLQEQLLSATVKKRSEIKVGNVARGISILRERLGGKKVLLVLDDLDKIKQFESLAGKEGWFASGSRIIVTTRDQHILVEANVDESYEIKELDQHDSLELFNWHAFRGHTPLEGYVELTKQIVNYAQGIPLALEILGSDLLSRGKSFWEGQIEKLKEIPPTGILETLRISFNSLEDTEKCIFLDIACCFEAVREEDALKIFEGCGFHPAIGNRRLIDRCLLKKSRGVLTMHDLLHDMGRGIVREKHPDKPEKHTRIWWQDDVCNVLRKEEVKKVTKIEAIILDLTIQKAFSTKAFEMMPDLRLIQINNANLQGNFEGLFKKVRWFCWHQFPLKSLPPGFFPEKLVSLDMQKSNINKLWEGVKPLDKLKLLNLNGSEFLTTTPNFTGVPNLIELSFQTCRSLSNVHPSIGYLHKLVKLNLAGCLNLRRLPSSIGYLRSLEILRLNLCSSLKRLPKQLGNLEGLKELCLSGTAITKLPDSIGLLYNLKALYLNCCKRLKSLPTSICNLISLRSLDLDECTNLEGVPEQLGNMQLEGPNAHGTATALLNKFCILHSSIPELPPNLVHFSACRCTSLRKLPKLSNLEHLELLDLRNCSSLVEIQGLESPKSVKKIILEGCTSLEKLPNLSNSKHFEVLDLQNCSRLVEIQGMENLKSLCKINLEGCNCGLSTTTLGTFLFQGPSEQEYRALYISRQDIPDCFEYQGMFGSAISFHVPLALDTRENSFYATIWVAYYRSYHIYCSESIRIDINNKIHDKKWSHDTERHLRVARGSCVIHVPQKYQMKSGDNIEVSFQIHDDVYRYGYNNCGVRLSTSTKISSR